ncbi:hypothetical protein ENH_00012030, partial [Eimeria necatrix]
MDGASTALSSAPPADSAPAKYIPPHLRRQQQQQQQQQGAAASAASAASPSVSSAASYPSYPSGGPGGCSGGPGFAGAPGGPREGCMNGRRGAPGSSPESRSRFSCLAERASPSSEFRGPHQDGRASAGASGGPPGGAPGGPPGGPAAADGLPAAPRGP